MVRARFRVNGPVSVFSRRGETLRPSGDVGQGEMAGRGRSERARGPGWREFAGSSVGRMAGQLQTGAVRLGVESLAAVPGRD